MKERNEEIKNYIRTRRVAFWQVAEKIGIADTTFSRLLRYPIDENRRQQIIEAVDELALEQE